MTEWIPEIARGFRKFATDLERERGAKFYLLALIEREGGGSPAEPVDGLWDVVACSPWLSRGSRTDTQELINEITNRLGAKVLSSIARVVILSAQSRFVVLMAKR